MLILGVHGFSDSRKRKKLLLLPVQRSILYVSLSSFKKNTYFPFYG